MIKHSVLSLSLLLSLPCLGAETAFSPRPPKNTQEAREAVINDEHGRMQRATTKWDMLLHEARSVEMVQALLPTYGSEIDAANQEGQTAVHAAVLRFNNFRKHYTEDGAAPSTRTTYDPLKVVYALALHAKKDEKAIAATNHATLQAILTDPQAVLRTPAAGQTSGIQKFTRFARTHFPARYNELTGTSV